jgi:hypothetical protein
MDLAQADGDMAGPGTFNDIIQGFLGHPEQGNLHFNR